MRVLRRSLEAVPLLVRTLVAALAIGLIAGCSQTVDVPLADPPEPITTEALVTLIAQEAPAVVNVWASWCLPCRSEAPLIATASAAHPEVRFIGLNVKDIPSDAARFIAIHLQGAPMRQLSDRSGSVPIDLGGSNGVPLTFFFGRDGTLIHTHFGAIDEPTLARYLDEIAR